ncbi:MAG: pyridoxal phosphate-dependent aminotransferase [Candidatus Omnitrophica bacterium]|nr:pyridoxal phosphate-dependent aminotransferase [Candidatus Omnitrophota bacterium]
MLFSKRTNWDRKPNALNQLMDELKLQGAAIVDLTESNPTRCAFAYPPEILQSLPDAKNLQYAPDSMGTLPAREAAGRFCRFDPRRTILTSSTSESYAYLFRLLLDPGDKVLVPRPGYPLFQFLLELNDAHYEHYPLVYDQGNWRIDFNRLERLIDGRTKAIIVVNPNNPTGSYVKAEELRRLSAVCRKHGLAIISDEVFFDYRLNDGPFVSLREHNDVLTFVLGGLSKSMGLPQMKLGWMLVNGPDGLVNEALARLEIIADTFLSVNTPAQNALAAWLAHAETMRTQILQRVKSNLECLTKSGVNVLSVEGGWYAVVHAGHIDEESFVLDTLRRHHILVHPGFFFDFELPGHLVLSLLPPQERFVKIISVLGGQDG